MKKHLLAALVVLTLAATEQNASAQLSSRVNGWSVGLKGGVNKPMFRALKTGVNVACGFDVEWMSNPLWGLSLDYTFMNYKASSTNGFCNEVSGIGLINLANLLDKYRRGDWENLNVYARVGAGISFCQADKSDITLVLPMGGSVEYELTRHLTLGLLAEKRWHTSYSMGVNGDVQQGGATNLTLELLLRYKFGNRMHMRHFTQF